MKTYEYPSRMLPEIAEPVAMLLGIEGAFFEPTRCASRNGKGFECSLVPATGWLLVADQADAPMAVTIESFARRGAIQRHNLSDFKQVRWATLGPSGFVYLKSGTKDVASKGWRVRREHARPLARRIADLGIGRSRRASAFATLMKIDQV